MRRTFKISTKLAVSFLLLTAISVFLTWYLNYLHGRQLLEAQTLNRLALIADIKSGEVQQFFNQISTRVTDFSSDGFIRGSAKKIINSANEQERLTAQNALREHLVKNKMPLDKSIYGINILDISGNIVGSSDDAEIGKSESNHACFFSAVDIPYTQCFISDIFKLNSFMKGVAGITASASLTDKDTGEKLGVIVHYVSINELRRSVVSVYGYDKVVFSGYQPLKVEVLTKDGRDFMEDAETAVDSKTAELPKQTIPPVAACRNGQDFNGAYKNLLGEAVLGSSICMDNGWIVVIEMNRDVAISAINAIWQGNVYLLILAFLTAIIIFFYLYNGIVKPLMDLSNTVEDISGGDWKKRVRVVSGDAIGRLANAFNIMTDKLVAANADLEAKVQLRTLDLQKFRLAVDFASDHIVITDLEGTIVYANAEAEKITGFSIKEMLGKKAGALWGKQMPLEFYKKMWEMIKVKKQVFTGEMINKRKNGVFYTALVNISPILNKNGEVEFFVGIERDITREKEIDRAKTEFVSIASHQLRTPLTSIKWYLGMMLDGDVGVLRVKQRKYLRGVYNANEQMIVLVNALLNVSRIDSGAFAISPERVNLKKIIISAKSDLAVQIKKSKLRVIVKIDKEMPMLNTDPNLMKIIIENILSNAVKYTPSRGRIDIIAIKKGQDALISIADTGYGIPEAQKDKIFGKLFRADNVRMKVPEGNGLGLYVVKSIINKTGGKIWFESKENVGTTFYVSLPLAGMKERQGAKNLLPV
jgi:PAS domain S-box-containing protein